MGVHVGYLAVKSSESERLLDLTNKYYEQFGLSLVQEQIAEISGKYVRSPKQYKDLEDYDHVTFTPASAQANFSTNFDFFSALEENCDWIVYMYTPRLVHYPVNINYTLASLLSKELRTSALEFYQYDVPSLVLLRFHKNGINEDTFYVGDFYVLETDGYFEQFKDKKFESYQEVLDVFQSYLKKIAFEPMSKEFSSTNRRSRHPMYLKGKPEDIISFLTRKQHSL